MFSLMYTGTCWRPLCTAIVSPMNSGRMVERRDQVLIGFLSLPSTAASTFLIRCASTNGPFLIERDMCSPLTCACDARQSYCLCVCYDGCDSPWSGYPMGTPARGPRLYGL